VRELRNGDKIVFRTKPKATTATVVGTLDDGYALIIGVAVEAQGKKITFDELRSAVEGNLIALPPDVHLRGVAQKPKAPKATKATIVPPWGAK